MAVLVAVGVAVPFPQLNTLFSEFTATTATLFIQKFFSSAFSLLYAVEHSHPLLAHLTFAQLWQ